MLKTLSGKRHDVMTGVALARPGQKIKTAVASTAVWFRELSNDEIQLYIRSGEPMDKAGAYGIQGSGGLFVKKINGCYFNVVGLPTQTTQKLLQ